MERLEKPRFVTELSQPPPLPAPAAGPTGRAPDKPEITPKTKPTVKVPVQPTVKKPPETRPEVHEVRDAPPDHEGPEGAEGPPDGTCTENCGEAKVAAPVCGNGSVELGEQCDDRNTANGDGCSSTCSIEVKPPPPPTTLAPKVLAGLRISGETQIHPSTGTQNRMIRDGATSVKPSVHVCISTTGSVSASIWAPTSYPDYDATVLSAVRQWRYQPYMLNGTPVPACSVVTFVYTIK